MRSGRATHTMHHNDNNSGADKPRAPVSQILLADLAMVISFFFAPARALKVIMRHKWFGATRQDKPHYEFSIKSRNLWTTSFTFSLSKVSHQFITIVKTALGLYDCMQDCIQGVPLLQNMLQINCEGILACLDIKYQLEVKHFLRSHMIILNFLICLLGSQTVFCCHKKWTRQILERSGWISCKPTLW